MIRCKTNKKAFLYYFVLSTLIFVGASTALKASPDANNIMRHTGLVRYADETELVPSSSGVIVDLNLNSGRLIKKGELLFILDRLHPGYLDVKVFNRYEQKLVTNIYINQGQYVDEGSVIAKLATPNQYKVRINLLSEELSKYLNATSLEVELNPGESEGNYIQASGFDVHDPILESPFYVLEVMFECKEPQCGRYLIVGSAVNVVANRGVSNTPGSVNAH